MSKTATLTIGDKTIELPILEATKGPNAVDIRSVYQQTGHFLYDPGFTSTASCKSTITYIDGDKGQLEYRGIPIENLVEEHDFLDISYLLLNGHIPNKKSLKEFKEAITNHTMVHQQMHTFFRGFRCDAHPMAIMVAVVGALSAFYHDSLDINDPKQRQLASYRVIAKLPTLAAMAYNYSIGMPLPYPKNSLSYSENFLYMMFSRPTEDYKVSNIQAKAIDRIFILHADHEQNASTSTVRLAGSSQANPFACIASGIAALWGPAHGGANEAVLSMLSEIGSKENIPTYIKKAKDKNDPFRLMGFGHRVYKNYDPRAKILMLTAHELFETMGNKDPLLDLAMELEKFALNDPYFIEKKLYPNVDFYSGIILKALGIPVNMFTVLFAIARASGWIAQWNEMITDPEQKIGRPRQLYKGI